MTTPNTPPQAFNDVERFGVGQDLNTAQRMAEERWKLFYPRVEYFPLKKAVTNVGTATETLSGETGTTKFDPLWGEAVDSNSSTWQQPHQSAANSAIPTEAANTEVRDTACMIHIRVQRTMHENMLKKLGFDRVRTLIGTVPFTMFDRYRIRPQAGDRFRWNDESYEVIQSVQQGWFRQTTIHLFWVLNVQSSRQGA